MNLPTVFELEMDVLGVLCDMDPVLLDEPAINNLDDLLAKKLAHIEKTLFDTAGEEFNLNSNIQVAKFVYDTREHKSTIPTKGGKRSTAKATLEKFANKDPLVQLILDYAEIKTKHSTFVVGLKEKLIDSHLYPNFIPWGTATGRLACRNPNLQNIPRAGISDIGDALRAMFISPLGHQLVVADYSQVEYRILACMSEEKSLIEAFIAGYDAHTATGAAIFGVTPEQVTKEQRSIAKNVNFAMVYGAGYKKVAAMSGISEKIAKEILDKTGKNLPAVEEMGKQVVIDARRQNVPHIKTILGRKRRLPDLMSSDSNFRWRAERQAFNAVIQGSAADVCKLAMVDLYKNLDSDMRILLTVHDEFVISTPDDKAETARTIVEETMQNIGNRLGLIVPLKVDAKLCTRWSDGK